MRFHILGRIFAVCMLCGTMLLCSCGGMSDLEKAYAICDEYAGATFELSAEITADYGSSVYCFGLRYSGAADDGIVTITSPGTVAGLSAAVSDEDGVTLIWDGAELYTGTLDSSGLAPIEFLPQLISCWTNGAVTGAYSCVCKGEDALRVDYTVDEYVSFVTWFGSDTSLPLLAEACCDGYTVIFCEFQNVTVE